MSLCIARGGFLFSRFSSSTPLAWTSRWLAERLLPRLAKSDDYTVERCLCHSCVMVELHKVGRVGGLVVHHGLDG